MAAQACNSGQFVTDKNEQQVCARNGVEFHGLVKRQDIKKVEVSYVIGPDSTHPGRFNVHTLGSKSTSVKSENMAWQTRKAIHKKVLCFAR
jgi:hypothetical protein